MLMLSRYANEKIMIGNDITIIVTEVDCKTGKVKIGIQAPPNVAVHRMEVYKAIKRREENGNRT
jgi:carbon storage regulator